MRLLALSSAQALLLALLTTAAIVSLYFLKHRRQRFVVSSIQLWRSVIEHRLENSLFEKLRRMLSIILALTIGLLLALALARPEIDWLTGKTRRVLVVLDTAPSMRARTSDGGTRWQHAVDSAQTLVREAAMTTQLRIADTSGQYDSPYTADRAEVRRLIERMQPVAGPAQFPDTDTPDAFLITDGVSSLTLPSSVTSISVFEPASNVAITAFEVRSMPTAPLVYEAYLELQNFGKENRAVDITISGPGQKRITKAIRILGGRDFKDTLDLTDFAGGGIRVSIQSAADALALDDVAYAYLPVKRRSRTLLVTRGNPFLETVLKAHPRIDLSIIAPDKYKYTDAAGFDALVFDRFAPPAVPARPALIVGTPNVPWLRKSYGTVTHPSVGSVLDSHPAIRGVSLHDVTIDRAARIDAANLSVIAATAGSVPLIVASERPRWVQLTFDLQSSDFAYHAGFPVFIDNTLAWFDREQLALRRPSGVVEVPIASAEVRTADGLPVPTSSLMNSTFFEAENPGLYVARNGDAQQYVAVNLTHRQYSDINNSHVRDKKQLPGNPPFLRRELWFYMLCAALLLFAVEWWTYHRRITE